MGGDNAMVNNLMGALSGEYSYSMLNVQATVSIGLEDFSTFMKILLINPFLDLHSSMYARQKVDMCAKNLESEMQNPNKSNWVHLSENIVIFPTGSHLVAKPTNKREKV